MEERAARGWHVLRASLGWCSLHFMRKTCLLARSGVKAGSQPSRVCRARVGSGARGAPPEACTAAGRPGPARPDALPKLRILSLPFSSSAVSLFIQISIPVFSRLCTFKRKKFPKALFTSPCPWLLSWLVWQPSHPLSLLGLPAPCVCSPIPALLPGWPFLSQAPHRLPGSLSRPCLATSTVP